MSYWAILKIAYKGLNAFCIYFFQFFLGLIQDD